MTFPPKALTDFPSEFSAVIPGDVIILFMTLYYYAVEVLCLHTSDFCIWAISFTFLLSPPSYLYSPSYGSFHFRYSSVPLTKKA